MQTILELLFESPVGKNNRPLFDSQKALAEALLKDPSSSYYIREDEDQERYQRELASIRVYLSQLFSKGVRRKLTEQFIRSLRMLVKNRLSESEDFDTIFSGIVNTITERQKITDPIFDELFTNQKDAGVVLIFTKRPIELDPDPNELYRILREEMLENLLISYKQNKQLKQYRFNLTSKFTAQNFWKKIWKAIDLRLKDSKEFDKSISANSILNILNEKLKVISVYHIDTLFFVSSFAVYNPHKIAEPHLISGYIFQGYQDGKLEIERITNGNIFSWLVDDWARFKEKNQGKNEVKFISIESEE